MKYLFICLLSMTALAGDDWANWRGPMETGATKGNPPVTWSDTQNIRWKTAIPGDGLASPVIADGVIYLLSAVDTGVKGPNQPEVKEDWRKAVFPSTIQAFKVFALDAKTGKVIWEDTAIEEQPHEEYHGDASWASASALVDDKYLYANFGSRGLFTYDVKTRKKVWDRDLGDMKTRAAFGEGSSPVVWGDHLVIQWDHEGQSKMEVLNRNTGETVWQKDRDERTTWATPLIREVDGKPQIITAANDFVRAYDLKTGDDIWWAGGLSQNVIPSPVEYNGVVAFMSGYKGFAAMGIKIAGAKGDITDSDHIVWKTDRDTPYVPSPVVTDKGNLYMIKSNRAIITNLNAETGAINYGPQRLDGLRGVYASPVAAAGRIYITGRDGATLVIEDSSEYKVLATNTLDDQFDASAAVVGDTIYLRGHKYLYAIGE